MIGKEAQTQMGAPPIQLSTRLERFMRQHNIAVDALRPYRIPRSQLLRYRTGVASPTVKTARRIIKAFNDMGYKCTANDLFALDNDDAHTV